MPRMTTADAAVAILRREGVRCAFGLPGAAINPFYAAMRRDGGITHTLARHVEGASHMAEGYTRARAGNIGVCVGTSGPAGTDMITGLYSASADSIPILCITGQAPVARLHKEDFQAVDIAAIAGPLTKMAMTVLEPAQVPGAFQQAFHLMRSGRPGPVLIDLPFDVQLAEIDFDPDTYQPLPAYKPAATRAQIEKALDMLAAGRAADHRGRRRDHQRRRRGPAHRVRRADRHPGGADADGLGRAARRPPADGGHGRPADRAPVRQRHRAGLGLRARHRQQVGEPAHRRPGHLHRGPDVRARRHRADPDRAGLRPRLRDRLRRRGGAAAVRRGGARAQERRAARRPHRLGARSAASAAPPCSGAPTSTTCRSSRSGCTRR